MRPRLHPPASPPLRSHRRVGRVLAKARGKAKEKGVGAPPGGTPPKEMEILEIFPMVGGNHQHKIGTISRGGGMDKQLGTMMDLIPDLAQINGMVAKDKILDGEGDSRMEKEKAKAKEKDIGVDVEKEILSQKIGDLMKGGIVQKNQGPPRPTKTRVKGPKRPPL